MRKLAFLGLLLAGCSSNGVGLAVTYDAEAPDDTRAPTVADALVGPDIHPIDLASPDARTDAFLAIPDAGPDMGRLDALANGPEAAVDVLQAVQDGAPASPAACPFATVRGTFCMGYWQGDRSTPHTWCVQGCVDSITAVHVSDSIGTAALCVAASQENSGDPTTHTGRVVCVPAGTCDVYCPS